MSFSSEVKEELSHVDGHEIHFWFSVFRLFIFNEFFRNFLRLLRLFLIVGTAL